MAHGGGTGRFVQSHVAAVARGIGAGNCGTRTRQQGVDGILPEGAALPVSSAWLQAGDVEQTQQVPDAATHVTFRMALRRGTAQIKSWWYDEDGNRLAGAYYLAVERMSD